MGVSVLFTVGEFCLNPTYLSHLDELAVLLLLEKRVQPVHRHPVVVLDLGEADPEYDGEEGSIRILLSSSLLFRIFFSRL